MKRGEFLCSPPRAATANHHDRIANLVLSVDAALRTDSVGSSLSSKCLLHKLNQFRRLVHSEIGCDGMKIFANWTDCLRGGLSGISCSGLLRFCFHCSSPHQILFELCFELSSRQFAQFQRETEQSLHFCRHDWRRLRINQKSVQRLVELFNKVLSHSYSPNFPAQTETRRVEFAVHGIATASPRLHSAPTPQQCRECFFHRRTSSLSRDADPPEVDLQVETVAPAVQLLQD